MTRRRSADALRRRAYARSEIKSLITERAVVAAMVQA
jgi:hypothetical protein